jgi:ABC-type antimicrobial peptide transport system permease subunit
VNASELTLAAQHPTWGNGYTGQVTLYSADTIGDLRAKLFILFGAVSFVFLIACVNVANLLLARGTARVREMGIRTALGATRRRLVRQLLMESAVLWTVAAVIGVVLASALIKALVAASPPGLPRIEEARIDLPLLLCVLVTSAISSVAVGLVPALRAANRGVEATLREGSHGAGQSKVR